MASVGPPNEEVKRPVDQRGDGANAVVEVGAEWDGRAGGAGLLELRLEEPHVRVVLDEVVVERVVAVVRAAPRVEWRAEEE